MSTQIVKITSCDALIHKEYENISKSELLKKENCKHQKQTQQMAVPILVQAILIQAICIQAIFTQAIVLIHLWAGAFWTFWTSDPDCGQHSVGSVTILFII
jgi:hypothetical protein